MPKTRIVGPLLQDRFLLKKFHPTGGSRLSSSIDERRSWGDGLPTTEYWAMAVRGAPSDTDILKKDRGWVGGDALNSRQRIGATPHLFGMWCGELSQRPLILQLRCDVPPPPDLLKSISRCGDLRGIHLQGAGIGDLQLEGLSSLLPALEWLSVKATAATVLDISSARDLKALRLLYNEELSPRSVMGLRASGVEMLSLHGGAGADFHRYLPSGLVSLGLKDLKSAVTPCSLQALVQGAPRLQVLGICSSELTDDAVAELVGLQQLQYLGVQLNEGVTDRSVVSIAQLQTLRTLTLGHNSRTDLTAVGLRPLLPMPNLQEVHLSIDERLIKEVEGEPSLEPIRSKFTRSY